MISEIKEKIKTNTSFFVEDKLLARRLKTQDKDTSSQYVLYNKPSIHCTTLFMTEVSLHISGEKGIKEDSPPHTIIMMCLELLESRPFQARLGFIG